LASNPSRRARFARVAATCNFFNIFFSPGISARARALALRVDDE
jgi:hypothetical protein